MRPKRVLVVEDSLTAREIVVDILGELGYETDAVISGEEALEHAPWNRFDAFVIDIRLPGMSGMDLLEEVKRADPRAIVVLTTGHDTKPLAGTLSEHENVWFFPKPANVYTLGTVLKNAFEAEELHRDVDRLRSLSLGIKSVGRVKDLDQEFRVLLHLACDSLTADRGVIGMADATASSGLRVRTVAGLVAEPAEELPVGGPLTRCSERQEPVLTENVDVAGEPELAALMPEGGRVHALVIPLLVRQKFVGVLGLLRDPDRGPFTRKDVELAKVYTATAAVALENLTLIAEARQAYERQVEAQRALIQSRKLSSLGQVTAGIAHEIKNPLTVILGNLGLIRMKTQGQGVDQHLDRIEGQCRRIHKLITDMKAVYHPGESEHSRFRLLTLVEESMAVAPPPRSPEPVEVVTAFGDDDPVVHGDFGQLLQVLVNLLSNAYQALGEKGGKVEVRYRVEGEDHLLEIRDDGPGIPEQLRKRIFEPFFTTKGGSGTGLGLWISQTILRSHGGTMDLTEAPGGGACFQVRLPQVPFEGLFRVAELPASSQPPGRPRGPLARILVIDDEEEIREYLHELLSSAGYRIETAEGPGEAARHLSENAFDVVILDERLQGASGREFYQRVLRPEHNLPTILFTGCEEIPTQDLLRVGFETVVRKPAASARILDAVRQALLDRPVSNPA